MSQRLKFLAGLSSFIFRFPPPKQPSKAPQARNGGAGSMGRIGGIPQALWAPKACPITLRFMCLGRMRKPIALGQADVFQAKRNGSTAARGGLRDVAYPWGNAPPDDREHLPCNIWQGSFPTQNTAADGYAFTSPARSFAPNGYGLYGMAGNVWDWTADLFRLKSLSKAGKAHAAAMRGYRVIKGGSFLCHASYCTRYRIAARTGNSPESTTSHMGFRIAFDAPPARVTSPVM